MHRPISSYAVFNLRRRSLLRGNLFVLGGFIGAVRLSGFPSSRATLWLIVPALVALLGLFDTLRCMQPRWSLYHGGIILCIYMDLMALSLILFFLFSPYLL